MNFEEQKFIVATHQMVYGAPQALKDYLIQKNTKELVFIGLPFHEQRTTFFEVYEKNKKIFSKLFSRKFSFGFLDYILDFLTVFYLILKQNHKYDFFFGVDGLNCLAGLLLKKMKKVNHVVFYSIDFAPIRFKNKILNYIFHAIEKICVNKSDLVWNVSPRIAEGREQFLQIKNDPTHQVVVPIGIWNKNIKKRDFKDVKKHQLLFVGHLLEKQGVQLVLDAIPDIAKRISDFKFVIVGGGEYENALKEKIKKLQIEKYVYITGWIREREKLDDMMSESACAIAVYKPEKEKLYNFTYYSDPTKLKDYLGAGLPIILTDVSYNASEIQEQKCGIIVDYERKSVVETILKLMGDSRKLQKYRENAISMANRYEWSNILDKAFKHE
ncbi:MAG: glycosyltransferase [Patescibacteria group bacterium]